MSHITGTDTRTCALTHPTTSTASFNLTPTTHALYHLTLAYITHSSWSSRVFTILSYHSIPFTADFINLAFTIPPTPSGYVPCLTIPPSSSSPFSSSNLQVTDSLAIFLTLDFRHPELRIFPKHEILRAKAFCAAAEMHSGFAVLRNKCPSNFWARYPWAWDTWTNAERAAVEKDIRRVVNIWEGCREVTEGVFGGEDKEDEGFLCGGFGAADAMYMPVLWRIRSFELERRVEGLWAGRERARVWVRRMWGDEKVMCKERMREEKGDWRKREVEYEEAYEGLEEVEDEWRCDY